MARHYFRLPVCSGTVSGERMRLVLRVMAASALIVMAYATEVSAQTGYANMFDHLHLAAPDPIMAVRCRWTNMFDHLHLAAPDPIMAVEWYRKNLGGQPMSE